MTFIGKSCLHWCLVPYDWNGLKLELFEINMLIQSYRVHLQCEGIILLWPIKLHFSTDQTMGDVRPRDFPSPFHIYICQGTIWACSFIVYMLLFMCIFFFYIIEHILCFHHFKKKIWLFTWTSSDKEDCDIINATFLIGWLLLHCFMWHLQ